MPHPFPCNYWPAFRTRHEARDFIVRYQEAGHIKRCYHAVVVGEGRDVDGRPERFKPSCRQDSMVARPQVGQNDPYGPNYLFHGCPATCHYYSPAWWASVKRRIGSVWRAATAPIVGAPAWFASLSAGVQTLFLAAVLVVVLGTFAPRLLAAIADFIKAMK